MLKCKDCKFARKVPGSSHYMQCIRASTLIEDPEREMKESFPLNFDPRWAEDCTGFIEKGVNLKSMSKEDLLGLNLVFSLTIATIAENDFSAPGIIDEKGFLSKLKSYTQAYRRLKKEKGGSLRKWEKEDLIYIIELSWTI